MFVFGTILTLPHKFTIQTCDGLFHMVTHKECAITYSYCKCALKYLNSTFLIHLLLLSTSILLKKRNEKGYIKITK